MSTDTNPEPTDKRAQTETDQAPRDPAPPPPPTESTADGGSPDRGSPAPSMNAPVGPPPIPGAPTAADVGSIKRLTEEQKARVPAQLQEVERSELEERIVHAIAQIYDPEIPVNIWELGLIYILDVDNETGEVDIKMTLTSPACPVAGSLPPEVQQKVAMVEGVEAVTLDLVWEPPWDRTMLSEAAQLQLGLM